MRVCSGSSGAELEATLTKPRQICTTPGQPRVHLKPAVLILLELDRGVCYVSFSPSVLSHFNLRRMARLLTDRPCNRCRLNRCFLPLAAALAFRDTPGLVAPAVRAFCSGDPADKKTGVRMARLLARPTGVSTTVSAESRSQTEAPVFVEARIAFTRHLYAQLHQAAFTPAKAFPPG